MIEYPSLIPAICDSCEKAFYAEIDPYKNESIHTQVVRSVATCDTYGNPGAYCDECVEGGISCTP